MKLIRQCFFTALAAMLLTAPVGAQWSIQNVHFTLTAYYERDFYGTNTTDPSEPLTNDFFRLRNILIGTGNMVKSLSIDLAGTNTTWRGSELVREVNLTTGAEGIFLRKNGEQTNVSSYFGLSFSNNFQASLFSDFPLITNNFTNVSYLAGSTNGQTNVVTNNFALQNPLVHGSVTMTGPTNFTTNHYATAGLYSVSFNTTNLKFNILCVGNGGTAHITGTANGTTYSAPVNFQSMGCAGDFYLNTATNIFDLGTNPPVFVTGPLRGSFTTEVPTFITGLTNGP